MNRNNDFFDETIDITGISRHASSVSGEAPDTNKGGPQIQSQVLNDLNNKYSAYENLLDNGYKLDWFAFTVSDSFRIENILSLLNYDIVDFEIVNGRYFYNSGLTLSHYVNIYFNDSNKDKISGTSDTVNFIFTGQGCTDLYNRNNCDIYGIFEKLIQFDIRVTRIDIAFDDFHGVLSFERIRNKLNNAEYRSSKKSYNIVRSSNTEQEELGSTIYIGSSRSTNSKGNYYLRMYDKKAQYKDKNQILPDIVETTGVWQRYEISFTKKKANEVFYSLILDTEYKRDIDKLYKSTLRNIVEFLEPSSDMNKSRWSVCDWWESFLEYDKKMNFVNHERDVDLGRLLEWLEKSVIPNLKALECLFALHDIDLYMLLRDYDFYKGFSKKQMRLINDNSNIDFSELKIYLERYLQYKE